MAITYHPELVQGSDEWIDARRGLITAGSMDLILTPTLKMASNEKERTHLYELLAQRETGYTEPSYISDDMLRGLDDEVYAKSLYAEKYAPVVDTGLVTNDALGFLIGFSPDGLVGDDGFLEIKSRRQKWQAQTIVDDEVPSEFMLQIQTGIFVTGRSWCDFISYCGGMPMFVKRTFALPEYQTAIKTAATQFEIRLQTAQKLYREKIKALYPTERRIQEDIIA